MNENFVPGRKATIATLMLVAIAWVVSLVVLPIAPDRIPTHWGINGQADRFSAPVPGLFLVPGIMTLLAVLLHVLPRIDPRKRNYAAFGSAYMTIQVSILAFLLATHVVSIIAAFRTLMNMTVIILPLTGMLMILLGNLLGKLRPNWFVGIRTPWTLASSDVWTRTHRFGGRAMVAFGFLLIVAGLVPSPMLSVLLIGVGGTVMVAGTIGYSFVVWRHLGDNHA